MKYLLIILLIISLPSFSQDKMGFGNDPEGADSAGFGTVTTWEKAVTDTFTTVTIGTQIWTKYNLHLTDNNAGIYSYNNQPDSSNIYGYLYSWNAAMRMDTLIKGYHLPSNDEWGILITYLGGTSVAGGKLKETGFRHWKSPNTGATNETGFTAIPGGWYDTVNYWLILQEGHWWSSTSYNTSKAYSCRTIYYYAGVYRYSDFNKTTGMSIRLIKD